MPAHLASLRVLGVMFFLLAACAAPEPVAPAPAQPAAAPAEIERKVLRLNLGLGDVPTLDPAIASDISSLQIIELAFVGLTYLDPLTSQARPGMATSWEAVDNADGTQTITFHVRQDVPWVRWNGTSVETVKTCDGSADRMVTAHDFAFGIQRNLDPATGSPYAYVWGFVLKGAHGFNAGATEDFSTVGVRVIDDHTISLDFISPAAYNVQIAGMWIGRPQPRWIVEGDCDGAIEARGERWTEPGFFQSYGPYTMSEWTHDSELVVMRNPFWPGSEGVRVGRVDEIRFLMLDRAPAFLEYLSGTLDAAGVPSADLDRVRADPVLSQELVSRPSLCTSFYGFNTVADHVSDARVRRALSMAIDRQGLIDNVTKSPAQPAQWFGRPGLAAAPTMATHPDLGIEFDPQAARMELQAYLEETGFAVSELDITLMFFTSEGNARLAEAIQYMWSTELGIQVELAQQEYTVFLETAGGPDAPQVWCLGWCYDYPDENNFVRDVFAVGAALNPTDAAGNPTGGVMWKNETFEELVKQGALETDLAKRVEIYAQAEEILVDTDAVIIPLWWSAGYWLVKPYVQDVFGAGGTDPLQEWDILPH